MGRTSRATINSNCENCWNILILPSILLQQMRSLVDKNVYNTDQRTESGRMEISCNPCMELRSRLGDMGSFIINKDKKYTDKTLRSLKSLNGFKLLTILLHYFSNFISKKNYSVWKTCQQFFPIGIPLIKIIYLTIRPKTVTFKVLQWRNELELVLVNYLIKTMRVLLGNKMLTSG